MPGESSLILLAGSGSVVLPVPLRGALMARVRCGGGWRELDLLQ
jgi:hypothetical protein